MFNHFVCRNLITRVRTVRNSRISTTTPLLNCYYLLLPNPAPTRFISSLSPKPNVTVDYLRNSCGLTQESALKASKCINFTVDYLINLCGLSPESALIAFKKVALKKPTTTRPDSVVSLLKSYGFTDAHISKLISSLPRLLRASPDKTLKPKLEYFNNIGISRPNLGKLISKDTSILKSSLEKQIIPIINFLRSFVPTDVGIAVILNRLKSSTGVQRRMAHNIALLLDHGIPKSHISMLMVANPQTLCSELHKLNEVVLQLRKMGISPSSKMFTIGFRVLIGSKKSTWDTKLEVYKSFGWSEDEVLCVFKKQPFIMTASVKKINAALGFFMNTFHWTPDDFSRNSLSITLSLEKRLIPRSYVLLILLSKGLISRNCIGRALSVAEEVFLKKYVIKFHNEEPKLLEGYRSEMGTQGSKASSRQGSEIEEL